MAFEHDPLGYLRDAHVGRTLPLDVVRAQADSFHSTLQVIKNHRDRGVALLATPKEEDVKDELSVVLASTAEADFNRLVDDCRALFVTAAYGIASDEPDVARSRSRSMIQDLSFMAAVPPALKPMDFAASLLDPKLSEMVGDGLGLVVEPMREDDFNQESLAVFNREVTRYPYISLPLNNNLLEVSPVLYSTR